MVLAKLHVARRVLQLARLAEQGAATGLTLGPVYRQAPRLASKPWRMAGPGSTAGVQAFCLRHCLPQQHLAPGPAFHCSTCILLLRSHASARMLLTEGDSLSSGMKLLYICVSVFLIAISGLMAGLTLGLLSLQK